MVSENKEDTITQIFNESDIEFIMSPNKNEIEIHIEPNIHIIKLRIEDGIILPAIDFVEATAEDHLLSYILERNYKGTIILWGYLTYALCEKGIVSYYDVHRDTLYIRGNNGDYCSIRAEMDQFLFE